MIVNIGASMALLLLAGAVTFAATWPDVPWTAATILLMAVMAVFPIAFYPMSKTVWLGIDLLMAKMDLSTRR